MLLSSVTKNPLPPSAKRQRLSLTIVHENPGFARGNSIFCVQYSIFCYNKANIFLWKGRYSYEKIGILCASDTELEPFFSYLKDFEIKETAMLKFYISQFRDVQIIAAYSGVCKVNAAIAAQVLIDTFHVDALINGGTAGGMDKNVQLLDTVISQRMIYHDMTEDILTDFHPWLKNNYFEADKNLLDAAKKYSKTTAYPLHFGIMVTGEQFIVDEQRAEINQRFAPLCVDMETASMAHVCYVNKIPFLSVRSITDTADHKGIENFDKNCEAASQRSAEVVMGILEQLSC